MGEVFFAGEEAQEGTTLLRVVVADGSAQHGIAGLERIQHRSHSNARCVAASGFQIGDFERYLAADVRQGSEVEGGRRPRSAQMGWYSARPSY